MVTAHRLKEGVLNRPVSIDGIGFNIVGTTFVDLKLLTIDTLIFQGQGNRVLLFIIPNSVRILGCTPTDSEDNVDVVSG